MLECVAIGRYFTMLVSGLADTLSFPIGVTNLYCPSHEMDATPWGQGDNYERQVRWLQRHGREQRVPEDCGLPQ